MKIRQVVAVLAILALGLAAWAQEQRGTPQPPKKSGRPTRQATVKGLKQAESPAIRPAQAEVGSGSLAASDEAESRTAPEPREKLPAELPPLALEAPAEQTGPSLAAWQRTERPGELPTGPQSPSLHISWSGLTGIAVGEESTCELLIRNTGQTLARDVLVHAEFTESLRLVTAEPAPLASGEIISWRLGQIEPRHERRIQLKVIPEHKGRATATATVTFSSLTAAPVRIEEPQIVLQINAPENVVLGDPMTFVLTVSNPGTSPAPEVTVCCELPEGLEHPNGTEIEYQVGTLAPDETRAVQVNVTAVEPGSYAIRGVACSGPKLKSPAEAAIAVVEPDLALEISGPSLRYLDREATYTIRASNPGSGTANSLRVSATIPAGFQFVRSSHGGKHDWTNRSVSWFIGQLGADETQELQLTLLASGAGPQTLQAVAAAERGLKAQAEAVTQVEGISALLLEVVDVHDPIEVGADTLYEIRVTNQGSKVATNIRIVAEMDDGLETLDYKGPVAARVESGRVTFDPLPKLGPRADATYRVRVRGNDAGDLRFRAKMTGDVLQSPVIKEESTRVYRD
jgi:uncharacterized repeat protein (TIGR01451 family)